MEKWIKVQTIACVAAVFYQVARDLYAHFTPTGNRLGGGQMSWIPLFLCAVLLLCSLAMYMNRWPFSGKAGAKPLMPESSTPAASHGDCIRLGPPKLLKLEDYTHQNLCDRPYTDRVSVILTSHWDTEYDVWSPTWKSKEVYVKLPLGNCLEHEGPLGWQNDDWRVEPSSCLTIKTNSAFRVSLDLRTPSVKGIAIRLRNRSTGCLLFPIKIAGELRVEKIEI